MHEIIVFINCDLLSVDCGTIEQLHASPRLVFVSHYDSGVAAIETFLLSTTFTDIDSLDNDVESTRYKTYAIRRILVIESARYRT